MSAIELDLEPTIQVTDEASKPIGKIEKSYVQMMKSFGRGTIELVKNFKNYASQLAGVGDATEDTQKKTKKAEGRFSELNTTIKENWLGLDRLGLSWGDLLKVVAAFSIGGAIVAVIGFFKNAVTQANEFARSILQLNEQFKLSASQMAEVSATIAGLTGHAGMTREQVVALTKSLLDLGYAPQHMRGLDIGFKQLATTVADFSLATGVADTEAAEFFSDLQRISKIPASQFRAIGAGVKYIADEFHISSSELIRFDKSLTPVMAHLSGMSGKARADFKLNMLALAGSLDQIGVNAEGATKDFGEMLNETSEEGNRSIAMLSIATKTSTAALRDMIKSNPAKVFDTLSNSLAGMDTSQIKLLASTVKPLGLSFQELTALADRGRDKTKKSFEQEAAAAVAASQKQEALAAAAAKRQTALDAMAARWTNMWRNLSIKIGTSLTSHLLVPLEKRVIPVVESLIKKVAEINWDKVFTDAMTVVEAFFSYIKEHKDDILQIAKYLGYAVVAFAGLKIVSSVVTSVVKLASSLITVGGWLFKIAKVAAIIFTPLGAAAAFAAVAVGLAAYQIYKHWDYLKEVFEGLGKFIKDVWNGVLDGLYQKTIGWVRGQLAEYSGLFNSIVNGVKKAFSFVDEMIGKVLGQERWAAIKDGVASMFEGLWNIAKKVFDGLLNHEFVTTIVSIAKTIASIPSGLVNLGKNLWSGQVGSDVAEHGILKAVEQAAQPREAPVATALAAPSVAPAVGEAPSGVEPARTGAIARPPSSAEQASSVAPSGMDFPSMMKTASPTTDRLLAELITVQKQTASILSRYLTQQPAGGVAGARHRTLAESAGNG